jgi:hypothetical protein
MEAILTLTFFAPMALLVAGNLLTHRSSGPQAATASAPRGLLVPVPPARARVPANEQRFLEAA